MPPPNELIMSMFLAITSSNSATDNFKRNAPILMARHAANIPLSAKRVTWPYKSVNDFCNKPRAAATDKCFSAVSTIREPKSSTALPAFDADEVRLVISLLSCFSKSLCFVNSSCNFADAFAAFAVLTPKSFNRFANLCCNAASIRCNLIPE